MNISKVVILALFAVVTVSCGGGGGGGGSDVTDFTGYWTGRLIVQSDTCGGGHSPNMDWGFTVNQNSTVIVVSTGNTVWEGFVTSENEFLATFEHQEQCVYENGQPAPGFAQQKDTIDFVLQNTGEAFVDYTIESGYCGISRTCQVVWRGVFNRSK